MIEYKSGERLGYIKKSPHSPECVSSMLAGALLSCFLTPYIAIPTYIIWLVLFFREVHFDNHKAFEKYLLK